MLSEILKPMLGLGLVALGLYKLVPHFFAAVADVRDPRFALELREEAFEAARMGDDSLAALRNVQATDADVGYSAQSAIIFGWGVIVLLGIGIFIWQVHAWFK